VVHSTLSKIQNMITAEPGLMLYNLPPQEEFDQDRKFLILVLQCLAALTSREHACREKLISSNIL
jgi:hypothetical protein